MKKGIAKFYLILTLLLINSCASIPGVPGYISESTSEFDGSKQIQMEPAWLYDSFIKLGLFKNTKMNKNDVVLTVVVKGTYSFSEGESLHFNIDGDIVSFKSIDSLTEFSVIPGHYYPSLSLYFPSSYWSSKDYVVSTDFIYRLINANRVVVKVDLRKTFVEGIFSTDAPTTARPAFKEFVKKLETLNQ